MHFTAVTPPFSQSRLARILACALLPACVTAAGAHSARSDSPLPTSPGRASPSPRSTPYLVAGLPPPLRFTEPVPPAQAPTMPVVTDPAHPAGIVEEIAHLNKEAAMPVPAAPPADAPAVQSAPEVHPPAGHPTAAPQPEVGVTILPDDTPRTLRAEDVLFYFQLPSSAPSAGQLPRSSATYQQK